ncbi:MAG: YraN family protein [Candidatus Omnitrophica bacterium]|nr:YraN family protein [Candidatus Omnitrophota bacterium]
MNSKRNQIGREGEDLAQSSLIKDGYKILERNYRNSLGEIDFIAEDKGIICFVEVKTRSNDNKGLPSEAVTLQKQRKISQVALMYLKQAKMMHVDARFDVVSILKKPYDEPEVDIIKDAFFLSAPYSY